jgi:HPt (histidine-containing phosphotransfer) domain-containing protein
MDINISKDETMQYAMKLKIDAYKHLSNNFDDEIIEKLLGTAEISIDKYLDSIRKNMILGDIKKLLNDFHAIRGMLANLGLEKEAETAGIIQDILKKEDIRKVDPILNNFMKKMTNFLIELRHNSK